MQGICLPPSLFGCQECTMKTLKVGGKVDFYRRALGLTVAAFARKCGVHEATMERICQRRNDPSARTLLAIIKHGGMSTDALELEDFSQEGLI